MTRIINSLILTACVAVMVTGCKSNPKSDYDASTTTTKETAKKETAKHSAAKPARTTSTTYDSGITEIVNEASIAPSNFTNPVPKQHTTSSKPFSHTKHPKHAHTTPTKPAATPAATAAKPAPKPVAKPVATASKPAMTTGATDATGLMTNAKTHKTTAYNKPGFIVEEEEGLLWVTRPGQVKSDKAVSLISKGPGGKTVRALDIETAKEYIATRPGFKTEMEDGRLWVLKPGQTKSDKHITMIGKGPMGMTIKAPDRDTIIEYLGAKPGFNTMVEDGRFWILNYGEKPKDKHVTFVAAGPIAMTVKANDRDLALAYFAAAEGFNTEIEDGRIWVLAPGEEKSDKHITRIKAGPRGMTIKGVSEDTLNRYAIATHK